MFGLLVLALSVLGGCAGTKDAGSAAPTTRTYTYDAAPYCVEVEERLREDGTCLQRRILFTANEGTRKQHLDQVRAIDRKCYAKSVRGFDSFDIVRSPSQKERYNYIARCRRRVNDGLWAAYQAALMYHEQAMDSPL